MSRNSLALISTMAILLAFSQTTGCADSPTETQSETDDSKPVQVAQLGRVLSAPERLKMQNDLRQIALFYVQYNTTNRRSPRTEKEFLDYIQRTAPTIKQAIEKKQIAIVLNVRVKSSAVIAYQREADRAGKHSVVMGDRSVQEMTTAQLKGALKK